MNRYIILVLMIIAAILPAKSQPEAAVKAYKDGDYKDAAQLLEKLAVDQGVSSSLYYDLGNTYMRTGNLGGAVLNYRRSLLLDPSNREAANNLQYLKSRIEDANKAEAKGKNVLVTEEDKSFFTSIKEHICYSHRGNTWATWAGIFFLIGCGGAALYMFTQEVIIRKIGFFGCGTSLGLCLIMLIFAFMNAGVRRTPDNGVIMTYKTTLKKEPMTQSGVSGNPLTQGTTLRIISEEKEENDSVTWYKVRLNSDYSGWISSEEFMPVTVP